MAKSKSTFLFLGLAALLIGAFVAYVWTGENASEPSQRQTLTNSFVDQVPVRNARALVALASTAEEQQLALQAIPIADDEVDLAFTGALRAAEDHPPMLGAEAKELLARKVEAEASIKSDQEQVQRLEATAKNTGKDNQSEILGRLDLAKAQLELDQDAFDDATEDLARAGGDPVTLIQEQLKQHESVEHGGSNSPAPQIKPSSFHVSGTTLESHLKDWLELRTKQKRLTEARQQVLSAAVTIVLRMESLRRASAAASLRSSDGTKHPENLAETQEAAKVLRDRLSVQKTLAGFEKRRIDLQQLSDLYGKWIWIVDGQVRIVWHEVLGSVLLILLIVLGVVTALRVLDRIYGEKETQDRRLLSTRVAYKSATQAIGIVLVLLAVFGIPNQVATVLALLGAGLTVALQDFVLGFVGWFTLMGRNGIRVGDWVEINGIGGEVIEIGLLRTVMLETGSWDDAGYPTGRKVAFINRFAIEGHFFNFTTSGHWVWDEIDVAIPAGENPDRLTEAIRTIVDHETAAFSASAQKEWDRATHNVAARPFSAAPTIDVRPTSSGMNLVVRYITQAGDRRELRSRLYRAIVALLYDKGGPRLSDAASPTAENAPAQT
ncbi:MAG TPA: mechanosensitive ion channel domain-containing protein [Candidatus Dormibacteraeota bacterium]|nr:mechanosensitive ion channel domain-containing protein [Candidatus Dormibacteraeota bacterium]